MPSQHKPDQSLDSTASMSQPEASSGRDGEDLPEYPATDQERLFAVVRQIMERQKEAASCVGNSDELFAGRFKLLEQLGKGGFGVVYRAVDQDGESKTHGQELALKTLFFMPDEETAGADPPSPDKLERIESWINEISRHESLGDMEGCVRILGSSVPDSRDLDVILDHVEREPMWLAMPVYRQTLAQYVTDRGGKLPLLDARRIMLSVARALQRMHNFGKEVIHRDLKPSNLLVDEHGKVVVADFGLSTRRFDQAIVGNLPLGTRFYIAPEQKGGDEATQLSDIFTWGVIFYEILSGQRPFGETGEEWEERITGGTPPVALSNELGVPTYLSNIVMNCLVRDPTKRSYGSFSDVLQAIRDGEFDEHRPPLMDVSDSDVDTSGRSVQIDDLKYHHRWLAYAENAEAEQQLDAFCNDPRSFLWWGVVGPGGVGKSRLAYELVRRLRRDGLWDAGFLRVENDDVTNNWLARDSRNWRPHTPTLIVIDYAARFARSMLSCLLNLSSKSWHRAIGEGARIRVLLLDRPGASIAPLSFEKLSDTRGYAETRDTVRNHLYGATSSSTGPLEPVVQQEPIVRDAELLQLGGIDRPGWRDVLNQSMTKAKAADSLPAVPVDEDQEWWGRVHRLTDGGRPLFLQILGICFARRPESVEELTAGDEGLETLLDDMLRYERQHRWVELFDEQNVNVSGDAFRGIERAVGFITLTGGITWPRDQDAVHASAGGSWVAVGEMVASILKGRHEPQAGSYEVPPLQPDLLGERLLLNLARRVVDQPEAWGRPPPTDPVETDAWIGSALTVNAARTIETLRRLAQDSPHAPETIQWTDSLLRKLVARFTQATHTDDTFRWQKEVFDLSSGLAKVVRSLAVATGGLDEYTQKLFLRLVGIDRWGWRGVLEAFFLDVSFGMKPKTLKRIDPLRRAIIDASMPGAEARDVTTMLVGPNLVASLQYGEGGNDADLALALLIASSQHGEAGQFERQVWWCARLRELAERSPGNHVTQYSFARGAVNAIISCAGVERWDELASWGARLRELAERNAGNDEIQLCLAKGAVNAIIAYGRAERLDELASWCEQLRELADRNPSSKEIQLELARGAVSATRAYGLAERLDELESWGARLRELADRHPGNDEIQLCLAKGAANAIHACGDAERWGELASWSTRLRKLAERHPGNEEIPLELAMGAVNVMNAYGRAERWDELASWRAWLRELAEHHADNEGIQLCLAKGALNAITTYGDAERWDEVVSWGTRLRELAERHPGNEEIQLELAKGAVNAIFAFGRAERWNGVASWGARLWELAERNPGNEQIQVCLAKGAVNAISCYGRAVPWDELESWSARLWKLADRCAGNDEIQLCLAQFAIIAIAHYGTTERWDDVASWCTWLWGLADRKPGNKGIQLELAKGAVIVISACGGGERWDELALWGTRLQELAELSAGKDEIQLLFASGAVNAIIACVGAERWDEVAWWGTRLRELADRNPANQEIQLKLAKGAVNAIVAYGRAERLDELGSWLEQLWELADRNPSSNEIHIQLAKGALSATRAYGAADRWEQVAWWGARLRKLAERNAVNDEIQLLFAVGSLIAVCAGLWDDLESSNIDTSEVGALVDFVLPNSTDDPFVRAILVQLARYWPGLVIRDESRSCPLVALVVDVFDLDENQRRELVELADKQAEFVQQYSDCLVDLDAGRAIAPNVAGSLWRDRRFLPDRGESLRPLIRELGMDEQ